MNEQKPVAEKKDSIKESWLKFGSRIRHFSGVTPVYQKQAIIRSASDPWRIPNGIDEIQNIPDESESKINLTLLGGGEGELISWRKLHSDGSRIINLKWRPEDSKKLLAVPFQLLPFYSPDNLNESTTVVLTEGVLATNILNSLGIATIGTLTGPSVAPSINSYELKPDKIIVWPIDNSLSRVHLSETSSRFWSNDIPIYMVLSSSLSPLEIPDGDRALAKKIISRAVPWEPKLADIFPGEKFKPINIPSEFTIDEVPTTISPSKANNSTIVIAELNRLVDKLEISGKKQDIVETLKKAINDLAYKT